MSTKSNPKWALIMLISICISSIVSTIQVTFVHKTQSFITFTLIGATVSLIEFAIFVRFYNKQQGFNGIGDTAVNAFVVNPITVYLFNSQIYKFIQSMSPE